MFKIYLSALRSVISCASAAGRLGQSSHILAIDIVDITARKTPSCIQPFLLTKLHHMRRCLATSQQAVTCQVGP